MTGNAETMMAFGHKQAWLAVGDVGQLAVLAGLGLRDLGEVTWRDAVDLAYLTDDRLLITRALPGAGDEQWTLVAGRWLLNPRSNLDIITLSADLATEVQFFATYRV